MLRNSATGWGWPARSFHWLVALLVIALWTLGAVMTRLSEADPLTYRLYQLHKSLGLTVFALVVLRLVWRLANSTPSLSTSMPAWQRFAAFLSHAALYLLLFLVPITGFLMVSASPLGIPTVWFGLLDVPHVLQPNAVSEQIFAEAHAVLTYLFAALALVHALAALKHHFYNRDDILRRMIRG
jgi:cytochrome b561